VLAQGRKSLCFQLPEDWSHCGARVTEKYDLENLPPANRRVFHLGWPGN
jgi:hypothetical protein